MRHLETPEDVAGQQALADRIGEAWQWRMWPTPTAWPYDYVAERRDHHTSLWEVKIRGRRWDPLEVSADKLGRVLHLAAVYRCPAYLAIGWPDGPGYVRLTDGHLGKLTVGGRVDRGHRELEAMVAIPLSEFRPVP